jgi:hypothetical protein
VRGRQRGDSVGMGRLSITPEGAGSIHPKGFIIADISKLLSTPRGTTYRHVKEGKGSPVAKARKNYGS